MQDCKVNYTKEMLIARSSILVTLVLFFAMFNFIWHQGHSAYMDGRPAQALEDIAFGTAMFFMAYGNLLYQICLVGYYKRRKAHAPAGREDLHLLYLEKNAPRLTVLVPSYKEELPVIRQTLLSAALAEYPHKNVVLLIDDPYRAKALEDMIKLEETRLVPVKLQARFDEERKRYSEELEAFHKRKAGGNLHYAIELNRLSMLYDGVAHWLEGLAKEFASGKDIDSLVYSDKFFVKNIILAPACGHRAQADELRHKMSADAMGDHAFIACHYARLASLFNVTFSSFERKKYRNLSSEANKAMNLNSYIALTGKSWKEVKCWNGDWELQEAFADEADFTIPAADYIDTLDADTVMLSEYALRLIHIMERPGNERIAVIQSPCSTLPECPNPIERVAGSCIDVQFKTHQGYTHWNASSWVGANAMLRYKALEEIKEIHDENGKRVAVYIQDRTVIEDTESTIDLVEKGWELYNYPERMTFSPTPPDFGSLLIQRRRWSNGGMIILPKLFSYMRKAPKNFALLKEMFMRFHYLSSTTTVCMSAALLFLYPFGEVSSSMLIPLSAVPCLLLFARDLKNTGYKYSDVLRIWALTLMLFPVMIGGVFKQFQQMITGKKIPFGRTPKVPGRTAAPAIYCLVEVALATCCVYIAAHDLMQHNWVKAAFSAMNAAFMLYALAVFMGVRATFQDMFAGVFTYWKAAFHHAEILPFHAIRRSRAYIMPVRKRA